MNRQISWYIKNKVTMYVRMMRVTNTVTQVKIKVYAHLAPVCKYQYMSYTYIRVHTHLATTHCQSTCIHPAPTTIVWVARRTKHIRNTK